jgi:ribosomal protein L7Ae-like RNA K-turn-binding protein
MSNDPVLSRLGFARKSNNLSVGFAAAKESVQKKNAKLIVIAADVSPKSEKEIKYFAKDIPTVKIPQTILSLSAAIGIKAGIVSVNDQGFADAILKQINP